MRVPARAVVAVLCMLLAALPAGDAAADPGVAASGVVGLGVAASGVAGPGVLDGQATATFLSPQTAAFLTTYVKPDGRVNRPDQGNDTVSEGQAYGLLLAETTGRDHLFNLIWQWTQVHLQQGNGLFAWNANAAGQIISPEPASDADLLIAWALLRYSGPGAIAVHRDGQRVANAVLAYEVTAGPGGMPILTAGPWATGRPATLDPSYWSLPALTGLAQLTGDQEWQRLAASAELLTWQLTQGGRLLPPDWAELTAAGEVFPESAPNGSASQPQYGLDAQRTVAWFAASCDPQASALAARWWQLLRAPARYWAIALQLDGAVLNPTRGVLPLVAAASAAHAAGASAASLRLLNLAAGQQRRYPGYYGGAWSALDSILISSHVLGC